MNDTPRTDYQAGWVVSDGGVVKAKYLLSDINGVFVHAAFARDLERELAEEKTENARLRHSIPRFALFAGHRYYPRGGAFDFRAFGTVEELKELYEAKADEWSDEAGSYPEPWGQIVDVTTMTVMHQAVRHVWSPVPNA